MLLESEQTAEVKAAAAVEAARQTASIRDRTNARQKIALATTASPPSVQELKGARVFFDSDLKLCKELQVTLLKHNAIMCKDIHRSNIFIAYNPWMPQNPLITWAAALSGAWVLSPACFLGSAGASMKYKPAIFMKRTVWASNAFQHAHLEHWLVLLEILTAHPVHSWKIVADSAQWAALRVKAESKKVPTTVLAFLSTDEARANGGPGLFNLDDATKFLAKDVDKSRGSIGLLNM